MTDLPKEKLPSIDELKATLFEIPKSLQGGWFCSVAVVCEGGRRPLWRLAQRIARRRGRLSL